MLCFPVDIYFAINRLSTKPGDHVYLIMEACFLAKKNHNRLKVLPYNGLRDMTLCKSRKGSNTLTTYMKTTGEKASKATFTVPQHNTAPFSRPTQHHITQTRRRLRTS
jgi:hypothetical protein